SQTSAEIGDREFATQHLERDRPLEGLIVRQEYLAHTTRAEQTLNSVMLDLHGWRPEQLGLDGRENPGVLEIIIRSGRKRVRGAPWRLLIGRGVHDAKDTRSPHASDVRRPADTSTRAG